MEREPRKRGLKSKGRGTYNSDKVPVVAVVAVVERGSGRVRIHPQRDKSRVAIKRYQRDVDPEAKVYTDVRAYNALPADK